MSALKLLGLDSTDSVQQNYTDGQSQTRDAFSFKWSRRESYESEAFQANTQRWLYERYCGGDPAELDRWLTKPGQLILDAGCGAGHSAIVFFGDRLKVHHYLGIDVSSAAQVARERFRQAGLPGDFLQVGISEFDAPKESFDLIFSEGVLHHTDDTRASLGSLVSKLKVSGRIAFYVYARKAAIREFTDDFIRGKLSEMTDELAWKALEPLTKLGVALGEIDAVIDVPEDIPYLGIKRGKLDLQRFFYWNICKMYYRPEFSFDEMNHINFDWFRPLNCHRHTPDEIREWCSEFSLDIERLDVQEAGITVVATRGRRKA